MGKELPFVAITKGFLELAQKVKLRSALPFSKELLSEVPNSIDSFTDDTTLAGFWKHYIGSQIAVVKGEIDSAKWEGVPVNEELVGKAQKETIRLAYEWVNLPKERVPLEEENIIAFLEVCSSFNWVEHVDLFMELRRLVVDLGDTCMQLAGELPLGYTTEKR